VVKKVRKSISRYKMFDYDNRIAVGVSGGKDSLSLLHILKKIEEEFPKSEIVAVSVDEGVNDYRDEALSLARKYTRLLGVEHIVVSFKELFGITIDDIVDNNVNNKLGITPCSFCGVLRRRALDKASRMIDADRLATGHTLDDMAQTALINIFRGNVKGLTTFWPGGKKVDWFVQRVKPLCEVPEKESTLFAFLNSIDFQSIACPYAEESMRTEMRLFLNEMENKHPGTIHAIFKTVLRIAPNQNLLENASLCKICGEPSTSTICRVCELVKVR
jgi:uncharacterized protein (TIGR00269 family)